MIDIAVIGDVHCRFDRQDIAYFNQSDYALLLFVGDLARYRHREGVQMAALISQLTKPALFLPGNHDAVHALHLLAEIKQSRFWSRLFSHRQAARVRRLQQAAGAVQFVGYSTHPFDINGIRFDLIAGRPFAMGGSQFSYASYLQQVYGIQGLEASAAKLKQCVDATQSDRLIFLAHNGPTGLGTTRTDIWGCDFQPAAGDFGDRDLQEAVEYARLQGKQPLAVVAGHMHHAVKGGGERRWWIFVNGIHYVNAAHVPRIFRQNGRLYHHHVRLSIGETAVLVKEMLIADY